MARRRRLANFADMLLKDYLERKRMTEQSELIKQRQMELADAQRKQSLFDKIIQDPVLARRLAEAGDMSARPYAATNRELLAPLFEDIDKATSLGTLSTEQGIMNRLRSRISGDASQDIIDLMKQRQQKEAALRAAQMPTKVSGYDPEKRTPYDKYVPPDELTKLGPIQTQPTPGQLGENQGLTVQAETPFKVEAANKTERETRGEKVKTAGATAYATGFGSQSGYMHPSLVDARVEEANRKVRGQANAGQSTEGERRAATNIVPLLDAHAQAVALEKSGAVIQPGAQTVSSNAGLNWLNQQMPDVVKYSPDSLNYAQTAKNFASTYTYLKSGVQSRQDEYDRYVSSLFHFAGDPATVRAQKTKTREVFLNASMIAAGRSKREGGRALGAAVKAGIVPFEFLNTLEMDPEFKAGVDEGLGMMSR